MIELDEQYRFDSVNPAFEKVTGLPSDQVIGKKVNEIIPEPSLSMVLRKYRQAIQEKSIVRWEQTSDYPSGRLIGEVSVAPVVDQAGNCTHLVGMVHDVTERKQAELKIQRLNRYLQAISDANQVIVRATDEASLLTQVCRCIVETGGYRFAWVGIAQPDQQKSVYPAARYGFDGGYLETIVISWADDEYGHGPTGTSIRAEKTVIAQNLSNQPEYEPWRQQALQHGFADSIAIPLISEGECLGALTIYSGEPQVFDAKEVSLLEELGMNLAFGVTSLRMRSARNLAEQALRLSEDKFKYVFDYSVSGKSLTQPSGAMEVNQTFYEMLGYSQEELKHRTWQEITYPEDVEFTQKMIEVLLAGEKEMVRFTKRFLHKNGAIVWTDVGTVLRRDPTGQVLYLMTSVNDITWRKQAEDKLTASETRYRRLFEAARDGILILDAETGAVIDVNLFLIEMLGFSREEIVGKKLWELGFFKDIAANKANFLELQQKGYMRYEDLPLETADGRKFHVEFVSNVYPVNHHKVVQCNIRDITGRKQAEEKLRSQAQIIDQVHEAIITTDLKGLIVGWNPGAERIFGYLESEALGEPVSMVFPQNQLAFLTEEIQPQVRQNGWHETEARLCSKSGQEFPAHLSLAILKDSKGAMIGMTGSAIDITVRKQAEEALRDYNIRLALDVVESTRELRETQEKLVRQEKLAVLGQLAGGVGHELRNPLAVINNAVYYLKMVQPDADEKVRKYHSMIEHEVYNAEKIIADLLDFARIKSVDRAPVAVPELVQRVLERFPAPESITTVLEFPVDLPQVFADPRQMEQVLGNLVVNACQAMASTGAGTLADADTLTISAARQEELVAIAVKDTGSGVMPENMKKLFEPLFTTKPKGIGLGLAVSQKLAEANGGRIEVQSEPGQGSTFSLYLPVISSQSGG